MAVHGCEQAVHEGNEAAESCPQKANMQLVSVLYGPFTIMM